MKDGIGYVRDELDYTERKGLWFCDKLVKWMPKDDDDEGQDGESVISQDILEWDGHYKANTLLAQEGKLSVAQKSRKNKDFKP